MLQYQFRPLEQWPVKKTQVRQPARFASAYSKTLDLLERELFHLGGKNVVIQADCELSEIRNDGMLRSNARMRSPGIIVSFDSKHGSLSYPCDRFTRWEDNLRAIALSLEALRTVDRYGVTRSAEQYRGWAKIESTQSEAHFSTAHDAAYFVFRTGLPKEMPRPEEVLASSDRYREIYRAAAARVHPDRMEGDDKKFKLLQRARVVLDKFHGI